ncbi:MAG: PEP-CTERM sorting domain-containing protein [Phycisphaerae bacterium]|jgi:hypothetical protein|nr:PEP-CTERM sorting domain-containing protein [Phycisphaerae bacterium]
MKTKPMTMSVVSGWRIWAIAGLALLMLCSPPAHAGVSGYFFSQITEVAHPKFLWTPAINASGQVSFWETSNNNLPDGYAQETIYKASVGSIETIIDNTGPPFGTLGGNPTINDPGDVAFGGELANSSSSSIVRYTAATQGFTTIATGDFGDPKPFAHVEGPSINNAGGVAYRGSYSGYYCIAAGAGGNIAYVDVVPLPGFLTFPMMRAESPTLEMAWWSDRSGSNLSATLYIEKGGSLNHTTIAKDGSGFPPFLELDHRPSISNAGDVSFTAKLPNDIEGVFYGNGGALTQVADTTGEFRRFNSTAISNAGIAFNAYLDVIGGGVYTGPNVLTDKVLAYGDTIPGYPSTVTSVYLSRHGMNDKGQIGLSVKFADGAHRILRADPYDLQTLLEGWLAIATLKAEQSAAVISQVVPIPLGAEYLSFDYHFPTTTGQLVVTLGGQVVAQIDAPDELADGFTTFMMTSADIERLFPDPPDELLLEFSLQGSSDTAGLFLDNIEFGDLENGDFATGDLADWRTAFAEGGGVGVAIDPFDPRARIPEPAVMSLLLMGAAGLLAKRRRQTA